MAVQLIPSFVRVIATPTADQEITAGYAATYNASEATAWATAVSGWTAPTGSTDPAETTYLQSCLTAARTAKYTQGSQVGTVAAPQTYGVGIAIIQRLLALGVNDLTM